MRCPTPNDGTTTTRPAPRETEAPAPVPSAISTLGDGILASGVPLVQLQVDAVTDAVAARLAIGLLGHVLFLKNQIPLPIPQLSRIPSKSSTPRGAKQRAELLASFDVLTSHLTTTFTALSLALYKSYSKEKLAKLQAEPTDLQLLDRAYLAVVLGPSLGTTKSRTFLAVDRFEARFWGVSEGRGENGTQDESDEESSESEGSASEDEDGSGDEGKDSEDREAEGPEDSDEESEEDNDTSSDSESDEAPPPPLQDTKRKFRQSTLLPIPPISYAEEQKFLQNSERLLSRTLAGADAEGYGFAAEMAPTQTHILIRAPRCFIHPTWTPRQNITASLESSLQDFLTRSRAPNRDSQSELPPIKRAIGAKKKKQQHSEGVWVTSKAGLNIPLSEEGATEEDEMIWWSWDGKISGFSEW